MNKLWFVFPLLAVVVSSCRQRAEGIYDAYFTDGTLRIDYFHTGDAVSESVEIDKVYRYDQWAGSLVNLIDSLNFGAYYYNIFDPESGELIYSKGFDSYFREYQTTDEAIEGKVKRFHESAIIPLPKSAIVFALLKRDTASRMNEVFRTEIDPAKAAEAPADPEVKVYTSLENGTVSDKVDIAIIGEGYTAAEEQKFRNDLGRFTEVFFREEPCKSYKDYFNVRGVLKYSTDSGVDEPASGIDKQTAVNASFSSLGTERYLLTEDNRSLRDVAGHAPYDALYIMVNHSRYGGGGIYNFYCVFTSDNINSDYLMVHEFGHSFFGLADEYYTSATAYNDFYPDGVEPTEPNITALLDPANIKWKDQLTPGISIPTPWNKSEYDSLDLLWQARRAVLNERITSLQKQKAPAEEIAEAKAQYDRESAQHDIAMTAFLDTSEYAGIVGAFEGAGYESTGLYRPALNCIMFSRVPYFCPVCQRAMIKVIKSYCE